MVVPHILQDIQFEMSEGLSGSLHPVAPVTIGIVILQETIVLVNKAVSWSSDCCADKCEAVDGGGAHQYLSGK